MIFKYLSYQEQLKIAEDLYNLTDSIEAATRLKKDYGIEIKYGKSVKLRPFARKLNKTKFLNHEIEKAILKHSGNKIDLNKI